MGEWQSEEDAPGGFRGAKGLIKRTDYRRHQEVFQAKIPWRTFLEDGTCIFAGRLKQPDPQGTVIQLSAEGRAAIADRIIGPILYQAHVGSEISKFFADTPPWTVTTTTMSHSNTDTGILFARDADTGKSGAAHVMIPFFGRDAAFLRFHMQGNNYPFIAVTTRQRNRLPNPNRSAELSASGTTASNWYFHFESAQQSENVAVDPVLADAALDDINLTEFTNVGDVGDTGWGFIWPDFIAIEVSDWNSTPDSSQGQVLLSNIEVNGSPLGSRRSYSAGDLVEDIAARLGFRDVNVGGSYDITPYELPPGAPASEALDWACLLTGKRYRILDTGSRPSFEFGGWNTHRWTLASPWSPLRTIPEERYDTVVVPYSYPGTHGQLTDTAVARLEDSPLARHVPFRGLELSDPAHNRDKALDLGIQIAEILVRRRYTGDFSAAEVLGDDGARRSAHHVNAGDTLHPWRGGEPPALRIGRLTRFDDHVEGEFDGEHKAFTALIARREKRLSGR